MCLKYFQNSDSKDFYASLTIDCQRNESSFKLMFRFEVNVDINVNH